MQCRSVDVTVNHFAVDICKSNVGKSMSTKSTKHLPKFYLRITYKYQQFVNQCLHFSTVLGAVIECKQYSGITVEIGTHIKSVKITKLQCRVE